MRLLAKILGVLAMLLGIWVWLTYAQMDCDPRRFGGCGLFDIPFSERIAQMGYYLLACIVGALGWGLFVWGSKDVSSAVSQGENPDV